MTKDKSIFIKNVYYMLSYAFTALRQGGYENIEKEKFENVHNLFAAILSKGIGRQLKQGLYREYVNRKASRVLIKKLESLTSERNGAQLQRQVFIRNRLKSGNTSIYYNVDQIHSAISQNVQISFQYCEWTVRKRLQVKKDGSLYIVSPWALTWDDENYYLVGCMETDGGIEVRHFRVDKMKELSLLEAERVGREAFEGFDLAAFAKKNFGMYGGQDHMVTLNCDNRLVGVIIDRFGTEIPILPDGAERFETKVLVSVSPQFFGWVTGIGSGMRITGPDEVVDSYYEYMKELMKQYKAEGDICND